MALCYCKECGKQIADSAPACPGCGAPQSKRGQSATGQSLAGKIVSTIFWLGFYYLLFCIFAAFVFVALFSSR